MCNEAGHITTQCGRALAKRVCYVCGSIEHLARECARRSRTSEASKDVTRTVSTNVVHPTDLPKPYMLRAKITPGNMSDRYTYVVDAMGDSGSPISLVRSDTIPCNARIEEKAEYPFFGINGSRLRIDGMFSGLLEVDGVKVEMKFYAVPSDTMAFDVLLGRDFLNNPQLHVTFGKREIKVMDVEETRAINALMHIDVCDNTVDLPSELKIDPALSADVSTRIREAYESCYLGNLREKKCT